MKTTLTLAAVFAALILVSADASANSKKGTPTCRGNDVLVQLRDGPIRCYPKNRVPQGATVVDRQQRRDVSRRQEAPPAAAPANRQGNAPAAAPDGTPSHTEAQFAQAAEGCLKRANMLAEQPGQRGCFVGKDSRFHCTEPGHDQLIATCKAEGNSIGRAARWNQ